MALAGLALTAETAQRSDASGVVASRSHGSSSNSRLSHRSRVLLADEEEEDGGDVADADPGDTDQEVTKPKTAKKKAASAETPAGSSDTTAASTSGTTAATAAAASSIKGVSEADSKAPATAQAPATDAQPAAKTKKPKKPALVNAVVSLAPAANVTNGDDINDDGALAGLGTCGGSMGDRAIPNQCRGCCVPAVLTVYLH